MKNLKNIEYSDCNLIVYLKTPQSGKFEALQSLKTFTIAPNLLYVALIPFEKLEYLKQWVDEYLQPCKIHNYTLQIRSAKDRKKVLYQVN